MYDEMNRSWILDLMGLKEEISIRCNAIISTFSQQEFPRMKKELENDLTQIFNPLKEFIGLMERRLVQKKKRGGQGSRKEREKRREKAWREESFQEDRNMTETDSKEKLQPKLPEEHLFTEEQKYSRRLSDIGTFDNLNRQERKEKRREERRREEKEMSFTKSIVTMEKSFYPTFCGLCLTLQCAVIHKCGHRDGVVIIDSRNNMLVRAKNIQEMIWDRGDHYHYRNRFEMTVGMQDMR